MPIQSCVTISLVNEAKGGPFVFWDDLEASCRKAAALGYDAVEVFAPAPEAVDPASLRNLLADCGLELAAVGTGAGWLIHRLTLTHANPDRRAEARRFIKGIIDLGGPLGAPAIIGSMQGRWGDGVDRDTALGSLAEALEDLGAHAARHGVPLIYEPLNRYETNLVNTIADGVALLDSLATGTRNVVLLADLFHMNIEEADIAAALEGGGRHIGHVHFVDSNRRPAGSGHLDFAPIAAALRTIGYDRYVSAEALPYPDPVTAARLTIESFRRHFGTA